MSGTDVTVKSSKGNSTLLRARFGPGMLLHHEDLEQLSSYTLELSRLIFRSFFGCGVVCGLVVETETKCEKIYITVRAGLALGCSGDPVYVPKDHRFAIDEAGTTNIPSPLWVVLCGTTKCCAPRPSTCGSDDDEGPSVCTRERAGFEIRVVSEWPQCACGCPEVQNIAKPPRETACKCVDPEMPCYLDHYAGKCGCTCGDGSECDCDCILLARLDKVDDVQHPWRVDHRVRRFVRPVLMRDPQVEIREQVPNNAKEEGGGDPAIALSEAEKPAEGSAKTARSRRS